MTIQIPKSTPKGQLTKSKRISTPIRLLRNEHSELRDTATDEQRSMSFIALRRYRRGCEIELKEANQ